MPSNPPDAVERQVELIPLARVGAPVLVCSPAGEVLGHSPEARSLMSRLGHELVLGRELPVPLWSALMAAPVGEATEWRPGQVARDDVLGCTRYQLGSSHWLLLMREVSKKNVQLLQRLHQQRLEFAGRIVASVAHDLRTSVASLVYNAGFLELTRHEGDTPEFREALGEMGVASERLQRMVDGLLDFARLGPQVAVDISVHDVVDRSMALLRGYFRKRGHTLAANCSEREWARGNPIVVEQILVNLLFNAAEASSDPVDVMVSTRASSESDSVQLVVADTGPGIPPDQVHHVFDPFFSTKTDHTGLGLTMAREAAGGLGGSLNLEPAERGARFVLQLPRGSCPREGP